MAKEKAQKRGPYKKGLKADYQGATPEQVAMAVLRYRPGKAVACDPKSAKKDG